jgi:putative addiction module component (TIGR02574 family)
MAPAVPEILKKALALPPEARAALAGSLLESLDEHPSDPGMEAAWSEEIKSRIEEVDSGAAAPDGAAVRCG